MPVYGLKSPGNDKARHAGVWTCAFAPMDGWSCLVPATFGKARMRGARAELRGTRSVVTVTDQGDAIRVPVQVNVFQHGVAKMGESRCV
jgi:hypothetical protein